MPPLEPNTAHLEVIMMTIDEFYGTDFPSTAEVAQIVHSRLEQGNGFSLTRLGDGEAEVLTYDILHPLERMSMVRTNAVYGNTASG